MKTSGGLNEGEAFIASFLHLIFQRVLLNVYSVQALIELHRKYPHEVPVLMGCTV